MDKEIEKIKIPGVKIGLLPCDEQMEVGVIMKGEGYHASTAGVTIGLNAGGDLQTFLDPVESNSVEIIVP